jgi:hypothetical protein
MTVDYYKYTEFVRFGGELGKFVNAAMRMGSI